ncbi:uncharacterized protein LOC128928965 [Callithrix jacchus]
MRYRAERLFTSYLPSVHPLRHRWFRFREGSQRKARKPALQDAGGRAWGGCTPGSWNQGAVRAGPGHPFVEVDMLATSDSLKSATEVPAPGGDLMSFLCDAGTPGTATAREGVPPALLLPPWSWPWEGRQLEVPPALEAAVPQTLPAAQPRAAPGKGCAGQETGRPQPVPELPCRLVAAERPPARLARAPGPPPSSSPACARERAESSSAQDRGREVLFAATSAPALGPLLSRVQAALRRDPLHAVPRRGSLGHSPLPSIRRAAGPEPRFPEQGNGRAVPTGEGRSRRPAFGAWRIRAASAVQENPSPLAIPGILFPSRSPKPGLELEPQLPAHRCSVPGPLPLDPEPPGPSAPLQPSPELSCPPRPLQPPPPAGRLPGPSRPAGQPRGGATRAHPLPPRAAARPGLSGRLAGRRGGPGAGGEAASARPVGASAEAGASPGRPGAGAGRAGGGGRAGPALGFLGPCTHARFPGASPSASPLPLICKITPRWVTLLLPLFRCESPDTTEISIQAPDATRPHAEVCTETSAIPDLGDVAEPVCRQGREMLRIRVHVPPPGEPAAARDPFRSGPASTSGAERRTGSPQGGGAHTHLVPPAGAGPVLVPASQQSVLHHHALGFGGADGTDGAQRGAWGSSHIHTGVKGRACHVPQCAVCPSTCKAAVHTKGGLQRILGPQTSTCCRAAASQALVSSFPCPK